MNIEFKLPELGENIESGDIVKLLVRPGDRIAANDGVVELETDKAVVEIPCPYEGTIAKILVSKGQSVNVGQVLLSVEVEEEAVEEQAEEAPAEPPAKFPQPESPVASGGSPVALTEATAEPKSATSKKGGPLPAGPAARRLARELGVDLQKVAGSGRRGRITPEDVNAAAGAQATGASDREAATVGQPGEDAWGPIRRERMSKIRRTIAAKMVLSATTIPHVTTFDDVDITELDALRRGVPEGFVGPGIKLTVMPMVMKAVALSLREHPTLNASLDDQSEEIVYKDYVNLGVAVDTPRGLVVPAVRNVDRLTIPQIAVQLKSLAERAREAQFAVEDLRGGTFTISNLGAIGGRYSTPIINHPEVAILLLGRSGWQPVVRDGKIESR
ncbi:MAG TPA: dihydrolipoamide acetyltransferase family protein, partial [Thermoguttaceae bacterium]|nr:dihydrolipoamide acetyltransferase family protein [Thermoguttaceae bacterium]